MDGERSSTSSTTRSEIPNRRYIRSIAEEFGFKRFFGLLTAVLMDKLAVIEFEDLTAFVTAGVTNPNEKIS